MKKEKTLDEIRAEAKILHERKRRTAAKLGKDFPLLPYECSWAFEMEFSRKRSKK